MKKRYTNQEWQTLIEQSESSSLPTRTFCKLNGLNTSTFYAKRQQLLCSGQSQTGSFAHARRKFMDAKKLQGKGKSGNADMVLAKIQKLYALESRLKLASGEARWSEKQSKAKPMLDDFNDGLISQKVIESSPLSKAIK